MKLGVHSLVVVIFAALMGFGGYTPAHSAQTDKPNILFIASDDTGWGDLGPYGGGEGRGMPTPNIDRMASEGMTFFSVYSSREGRMVGPLSRSGSARAT